MIFKLSRQVNVSLTEFANRRLRTGFNHALSAFSVSHCFAGCADDFLFTQFHSSNRVGFHSFNRTITLCG